jgi:hypothetical protein
MSATKKPLFVTGKDAILKAIGSIGRASLKLNKEIQSAAVSCVMHAVAHGDVTLADQLVDACGKGVRRDSLRAWFEKEGAMVVNTATKKFGLDKERMKGLRGRVANELAVELLDKPWDEAKREPEVISVIDIDEQLDKFMARINKLTKDAAITVKNRELLDRLNVLSSTYHAEKILGEAAHAPVMNEEPAKAA